MSLFYRLDKPNAQMAKFEAFVAYNEATWRLKKNLFSYNSKTRSNVKTSRKNDYFFKKKWLLF